MRTLFIYLWMGLSFLGMAQSDPSRELSISGKIVDEEGHGFPFANVLLYQGSENKLIKATFTSEEGEFNLSEIDEGSYILQLSSVGYQKITRNVELSTNSVRLEEITLRPMAIDLDQVTVKGQKAIIEVKADKTVFNVNESLGATGTSGFELLRKAPGVVIDNNDNLILEGKSGVRIYINGRPSQLSGSDLTNYLQSIQSSDIESIEIITQPSSKYEAEGNAGIVNILLKKEKGLGINGSLNASLNVNEYLLFSGSASLNWRTKNTNLYANYSNSMGEVYRFFNIERTQNGIVIDSKSSTLHERQTHNFRLGMDHDINKNHSWGFILNGSINDHSSPTNSRTLIHPLGNSKIDSILIADNEEERMAQNVSANLNYRYKNDKNASLNIDLDYAIFANEREFYQPNTYYNPAETKILSQSITFQNTPTRIDIASFKVDYEQPLFDGILAIGGKASLVVTDNDFLSYNVENGQQILDSAQTNEFTYRENVNAAYMNYKRQWQNWNVQLGMRVENTISEGRLISIQDVENDVVKRNYTNFFASGGITRQFNEKHSLALNYSRRIQRPNYERLNPFIYKINELSFRKGNPFLQPQYTDNIKVSHTFKRRFTTSLSYSFVEDFFAQVTEQNGEKGSFINSRNVANQQIINLGMSYPFSFTNWWSLYTSINAFYSAFEATNDDFVPIDQTTMNIYAQNTFSLPWDIKMEISGWFNTPSIWGGTFRTDALGALNIAFQRKFMNNKLSARLAFNDIFYTAPWNATTTYGNISIVGHGGRLSRMVTMGVSYNFGDKEVKKARKRETGLEEERSRVGN